jgi:hypothetical protein
MYNVDKAGNNFSQNTKTLTTDYFIFISQINCTVGHQTIIKTNLAGTEKSMTDPQRWAVQLTRDSASDDTGRGTAHQCH